jgi:hypothetical protein
LLPAAVRKLQHFLNKKFSANLDVDGVLGDLTRRSIEKYMPTARVQGVDTKIKGGIRVNNCVPNESINEAGSPAQQAAIAIAMKKAGKKPRSLDEQFDMIEAKINGEIVSIPTSWDDVPLV